MWTWLGNLIAGPIIGNILKAYQSKLEAAGSTEARKVELAREAMSLDKREAELNNALLIAEQGNWLTRSIRPLLALPVIILLFKVLVYDKALGEWTGGRTDALDPNLWGVVMAVVVAYMGGRTVEKVATTVRDVFKR